MRLNLDTALVQNPETAAPAGKVSGSGHRSGGLSAAGNDSIRISGASSALHRLAGERADRLDALSKALAAGSYDVSSAAIGSAIIRQAGG